MPVVVLYRVVSRVQGQKQPQQPKQQPKQQQQQQQQQHAPTPSAPAPVAVAAVPVADIVAGVMPVADAVQHFHLDPSCFPLAVQMNGKQMAEVQIHRAWRKAAAVILGLSLRVRRRHRQLLLDLQEAIRNAAPGWDTLPLADAAIQFIEEMKLHGKRKAWSEASTFRNMTALAGALTQLPVYSNFPSPVNLADSASWKSALRRQEMASKQAEPVNQAAMDYTGVSAAIAAALAAGDSEVAVAIMLTWICAGRAGDATRLHKEDLTFEPIPEVTNFLRVKVLVRRSKTAALRDPYTIHTLIPRAWKETLDAWSAPTKPEDPLFQRSTQTEWSRLGSAVTKALRTADPSYGQRALRRGALQTLAADPTVDLSTLRTFSGHTTDEMCLRYLNWGMRSSNRAHLGQEAAANLFPQVQQEPAATTTTTACANDEDCSSTSSSEDESTASATSRSSTRRH